MDSTPADAPSPAVPIEADAVVIGAGPVGLFQVFQLGLLEIKAHVIDSLPHPGGQCVELYPDKPIYDIPGVPFCTGRGLVDTLRQQIKPFGASFHLDQEVTQLQKRDDARFDIATRTGTRFIAKTVFVAGGVGSFQPRLLRAEGLDAYQHTQVLYHPQDPAQLAGKDLVVVGGGDVAVEQALALAEDGPHKARRVTLIHRRDDFSAPPERVARLHQLCKTRALQFIAGHITGIQEANGRLTGVQVTDHEDVTHPVPLDLLLVFLGLSPRLGPIANWGLHLDRKQVVVDTEKFETNVPGLFAVGDINLYPGKKKLILCGFHEATLAAYGATAYVFPDKRVQLQYTTTSPKLHKLLGVETPSGD